MADDERLLLALEDTTSTGFRVAGLRILNVAAAFAASVVIARALGPQGRGLVALPIAFLGIVMALAHAGIEHSNVYLAARGETFRRLWAASALIAALASVVAWIVISIVAALVGPGFLGGLPPSWIAVAVAQLPLLLTSLYWAGLLQLDDGLTTAVRATVAGTIVHASVIVALAIAGGLTPFRVLAVTWVSVGVTWGLLLRAGVRRGTAGSWSDRGLLRRSLAFGLRAQFATLFTFLLLRVDQLLVQRVLGFEALGLYALAVVLAELLWLATDPFAASLLPHQVRAADGDDRRLGFATARLGLVVALGLCLVGWIAAPYAIRFAYGEAFVEATWAFRWLLPGVAAIAAQRPLYAIVTREGRMGLAAAMNAAALAVNVVLNVVLLERLGIVGASLASSVTYILLGVGYVLATRRRGVAGWRDLLPRRSDLARIAGGSRRTTRPRDRRPGPPRIVYVIGTLERGGTEGQLASLSSELSRAGWQVTILCLSSAGPLAREVERHGVEVVVAGFRGLTPVLNPMPLLRVFRGIRRAIAERDPDVVHTFLYWGNLIGVWAGRRAGVPVVVASLRSLRDAAGSKRLLRPWERWTCRRADVWVCNSRAVLDDAVIGGVPSERSTVIPNGVRLPDDVRAHPPTGPALCIANLIGYKGHDVLLDAFARAAEQVPNARLWLAGSGPERTVLRERAATLGIAGRVEFLGSVGNVQHLLDACAFTVLASRSEGMPNVVLESLAAARPVIASAVGGVPELLEGGGGILVPAGDVDAFARAMIGFWSDPGRAAALGEAGRRDVASRFSLGRMVDATSSLYGDLLERRGVVPTPADPARVAP